VCLPINWLRLLPEPSPACTHQCSLTWSLLACVHSRTCWKPLLRSDWSFPTRSCWLT